MLLLGFLCAMFLEPHLYRLDDDLTQPGVRGYFLPEALHEFGR
jgi:hypothetical protein